LDSQTTEQYTPPTMTVIGTLNADTLIEALDSYSCPKGSR
jgi:hypothetical protein